MTLQPPKRTFANGARVEVWRPNRDEWVVGTVLAYEDRDGKWKYFVQLSGYMAASPADPNCWFDPDELRPAGA